MAGLNALWFMNRAARRIGDPAMSRVSAEEFLDAVNLSLNDLCTTFDLLEFEDDFDIPAAKEISYPDQCTRVTRIDVSPTPSDPDSFVKLEERFADEFTDETGQGTYPVSNLPERYLAAQGAIKLTPKASAEVESGGIITYYGTPDLIVDAGTVIPIPDFLKSYLLERVIIYALEADERMQEAGQLEVKWRGREESIRDLIEDRSLDRRTALRPQSVKEGNRGLA